MLDKTKQSDEKRRAALIEECEAYVRKVAGHFCKVLGIERSKYDDLLSAGYMGLVEAAQRYDFKSGKKFKSYAYLRIRGAIIDGIREDHFVKGRGYRRVKAYKALQDDRQQDFVRQELDKFSDEKAAPTEVRLAKIFQHAAKGVMAYRLSMSDIEQNGESPEFLSSKVDNPEELLSAKQDNAAFADLVQSLPEKEKLIIVEYYVNGKSFADISREYPEMSKSWISRLHSKALDTLRKEYEKVSIAD